MRTRRSRRAARPPTLSRPAAIQSLVITLVHASLMLQLSSSRSGCSCEAAAASTPLHFSATTSLLSSRDDAISTASGTSSIRRIAFVVAPRNPLPSQYLPESLVLGLRGGDDAASADDSDDEEDSEQAVSDVDEEEVEAEASEAPGKEDLDASLSASAVKSAIKSKVKKEIAKKQAAKRAMNVELKNSPVESSKSKKLQKKKATSSVSFFRVPYVIRASLNPVTVFKMTIAYWASLFDLDYLSRKEAPAQDLRSAIQEKARYEPSKKKGSGSNKKQMKRGQAKTLSDLPQLSS